MVKILSAVLTDGLAAVEAACAEALGDGVHSADVVLNILARRRDPAPAATILTPEALRLHHAPIADCARYDSLRRASDGTHRVLELMATLKLYGMRAAYDEVMATASSASTSRRASSAICSTPRSPRSRRARSSTS